MVAEKSFTSDVVDSKDSILCPLSREQLPTSQINNHHSPIATPFIFAGSAEPVRVARP
jgi:hypothetical protein